MTIQFESKCFEKRLLLKLLRYYPSCGKFGRDRDSDFKIMMAEKKENQTETATEDFSSEINEARWSVVSFEKRVAKNLTYAEAAKKMKNLAAKKVAGLCIITNEAAARISNGN